MLGVRFGMRLRGGCAGVRMGVLERVGLVAAVAVVPGMWGWAGLG